MIFFHSQHIIHWPILWLFMIHSLVVYYLYCCIYGQIVKSCYPTILTIRIYWLHVYKHNHFNQNYFTIAKKEFFESNYINPISLFDQCFYINNSVSIFFIFISLKLFFSKSILSHEFYDENLIYPSGFTPPNISNVTYYIFCYYEFSFMTVTSTKSNCPGSNFIDTDFV